LLNHLPGARYGKHPARDVLRYGRTGGRVSAGPDADRGHQIGIGADKSAGPDYSPVLVNPVVVAGYRARADVDLVPHLGVADVAVVVHLGAAAYVRFFHFREIADLGRRPDVGERAKPGERPHHRAFAHAPGHLVAGQAGAGGKKLIEANPLVQDKQKLVPSVTRVFHQGHDMYVFLEAYQPGAEKTQFLVATVSFYRGSLKAFETAPLQISEGLNARSKAVPVSFTVPLGKLQPGRYTCQVNVIQPGVRKFAVWRSAMVVLPE